MKRRQTLSIILGSLFGAVLVSILCITVYVASLFRDSWKAVNSIHEVAPELYEMTYVGDYGLDEYIAQGGVRHDMDLRPFLQNFLSHGLLPVDAPAPELPDFGCSTLCAPMMSSMAENQATNDIDGYLFGRNFDWAKKGNTIIVRTYPKNGYASISTSNLDFLNMPIDLTSDNPMDRMPAIAAIYVALDGINERGLMVADLFAGDHEKTCQERGNLAVTTTTAIRLLLDHAATTDEAIDMLGSWDMHSSIDWAHHLAIADATGHSVVVEWLNNEMVVTETPAVTNHYLTPLRPHVGIGATEARRDTLCARLEQQPRMSTQQMTQLLSDVSFDDYTCWSVVFDTKALSATYYYRTDYSKSYVYMVRP